MGSIADKILYLDGTKQAIKTAIEAKGGVIAPEDTFRSFANKISEIPGYVSEWARPSDWIDISQVNDNEINLLIGDFGLATMSFSVTTQGDVDYTVNWGDGNTINYASGATAQHTYALGTGQVCSLGYTTFKAVISCISNPIIRFNVKPHSLANQNQYLPLLECVVGTTALVDCSYMFYMYGVYCYNLLTVILPDNLNSVLTMSNMCNYCDSLLYIRFPLSMNAVTSMVNMCRNCHSLIHIKLPNNLDSLQLLDYAFSYCYSLTQLILPNNLDSVISMAFMLSNSYGLRTLTLPFSIPLCTAVNGMVYNCHSLVSLINCDNLGSNLVPVNFYDFSTNDEQIESLSFNAFISMLGVKGQSGKLNKLSSLRLLNANSTFTGSSPQIDCSYCDLGQAALVTLFGDLPVLAGKTINITGCTGAAALTAPERAIATDKGWTIIG